jgi:hypothetical protein
LAHIDSLNTRHRCSHSPYICSCIKLAHSLLKTIRPSRANHRLSEAMELLADLLGSKRILGFSLRCLDLALPDFAAN